MENREQQAEGAPEAVDAVEPAPEAGAPREEAAASERDAELEALRDRHLRLAAEYDNYRKRTERERAETWARAQAQLVEQLLGPLDDLERVADFTAETTTVEALLEGVQIAERKLLRALEAAGLERVEAQGKPFDPALHDAVMTVPAESREEDDVVAQMFQAGYQFKGVLLRPARVQVKKHGG